MTLKEAVERLTPNALYLWLWLLVRQEGGEGVEMSLAEIGRETNLTFQNVRTAVAALVTNKVANKVANKVTNKRNTIVVSELEGVSVKGVTKTLTMLATNTRDEKEAPSPATPTTEKVEKTTTKKKDSLNESPKKKVPPIGEKQKAFYESLIPFVDRYGAEMVREFYNYWSEPYQNIPNKMRYEGEKTWDLARRLANWKRMDRTRPVRMQTGVVLQTTNEDEYEEW